MPFAVSFNFDSIWGSGYTAQITLTNTGSSTITGWELGLVLPGTVEETYSSTLVSSTDGEAVLGPAPWTETIEPGESESIKYKADGPATPPSQITIGGQTFALQETSGTKAIYAAASEPPPPSPEPEPDPAPSEPDPAPDDETVGEIIDVAAGTGVDQLQQIVDSAPAGAEIRLAAGTFTFDEPLVIDRDDISIRGAGSGETQIRAPSGASPMDAVIHIDGGSTDHVGALAADVSEGARAITLESGHGFRPGDFLMLQTENTSEWLDSIGDELWREPKPLRNSLAKVTAVDGNRVTLEDGVHFDFEEGTAQVYKVDLLTGLELGGFSIDYGFGEADPGRLSNTESDWYRANAVHVDGTYRAELDDIAVNDAASNAFTFERSSHLVATDLAADGAHNKGTGGNGYAFQLRDVYESSLTGLEDHGMRHSVVFGSWYSAVDNEVQVDFTDRDINFHGGRDHGNSVVVTTSERDPRYDDMSPTLTINTEGETWGAPTDFSRNSVVFDRAIGTRRDDLIFADDDGAYLDGRGADDTLVGGRGNDVLNGGSGDDVVVLAGLREETAFTDLGDGRIEAIGPGGRDRLVGIEQAEFEDGQLYDLDTFLV